MARIIQFDGRRIQVPDDATDDEIRSILDGGGAATPVAAPAPVSPPAETSIQGEVPAPEANRGGPQRALQLGIQDAGRSVANTVGLLPDLVNTIINLGLTGADMASGAVGGPDIPFRFPVGAGDTIAEGAGRVADAFGAERIPWEDRTGSEKLIGNIVDLGGQAGLAGGSLAARAPALAERIASGAGPRATDALVRPYLNGPGATLAGDIASGAGAGAGQTAAEEYFPDNPLASFLLTLAGGVGGVTGVEGARIAGGAGRTAFDNLVPERAAGVDPQTAKPYARAEVEEAARKLQDATRDPQTGTKLAPSAAASIGENAKTFRDAGLPVPTSGLISDNLGLQAGETALRTGDGAPFVQQDNKLRAAATDLVDSLRDPGADRGAVAQAAQAARMDAVAPARVDVALSEDAAAQAAARRAGQSAPLESYRSSERGAEASRRLDRAVVDEGYIPDRAAKNAAFDAVDPGRTEMVDSRAIVDAVDSVWGDVNRFAPIRDQVPEFADRLGRLRQTILGEDGEVVGEAFNQVAVGDLVDLRKYMSTARAAARDRGAFDLADNIGALQRAIDETTAASPAAGSAVQNYRRFAERYRPGPGDEMARFTRDIDRDNTRTRTPPEKTAGRFLSSPDKAEALRRVLADAPSGEAGRAAVREYLMHDLASSALDADGVLKVQRATAWADANDSVLAAYPDLRREVDQIVKGAREAQEGVDTAARRVTDAKRSVDEGERAFERSQAGALLRDDPRNIAQSLLSGKRFDAGQRLEEISRMVAGNPDAARGWKAAVVEAMTEKVSGTARVDEGRAGASDTFRVELGKIDRLFKRHRADLARVFSPEEMHNLQMAQAVLEPLKNATMRATAGSNTADKFANMWRVTEAGLKAKYGVLKGGGILRTLRIALDTLPNNKATVETLIKRAYFDPDLAQYLLTRRVRDFDEAASNAWIRRALAATTAGRTGDGE